MGLFVQHTGERNLIRTENYVKCFHSEFLGPAILSVKSRTYERVVSLFKTTDCLYAGKAIR